MKKIDVLMVHKTQYGVLRHFTEKLYQALVRASYDCRLLEGAAMFLSTKKHPPDLTIGFNGVPRDKNGYALCDLIKRPHLTILVDPPYRFLELTKSPYMVFGCEDREECEYLHEIHFERALFIPHAIEPDLEFPLSSERIYDVAFPATFIDSENRIDAWRHLYPGTLSEVMTETVEQIFQGVGLPFTQIFFNLCKERMGMPGLQKLKESNLKDILQSLELVIKGKERLDLVRSIHNTPVHIFGDTLDTKTWQEAVGEQKNVTVHPPIPFTQIPDLIGKTKILLNSSLKNSYGAHERIFAGLALGALPLTSRNPFLEQDFKDREMILYYDPDHLSDVNDMVCQALAQYSPDSESAQKARNTTLSKHTWDSRIAECLPAIRKFFHL